MNLRNNIIVHYSIITFATIVVVSFLLGSVVSRQITEYLIRSHMMTRIFSVAFFHHFAFLIISTALFGFGFSGVFLSIFPFLNKFDMNKVLATCSACFSISTILTLKVMVEVPLQFGQVLEQSFEFFVYLSIYYLALAIPFCFSGMAIALLLSTLPERINTLYFSNLSGAGIGCFLVLPLIPSIGAPGTAIMAALFGVIAAASFGK